MSVVPRSWPLAFALLLACGRPDPAAEAIPDAGGSPLVAAEREVEAGPEDHAEPEAMIAVLVPAAELTLAAPGFARVTRLDLQLGDHVDADALVAELELHGERSELSGATAAWRAAKAERERLELELEQARDSRSEVEALEDYVSKAELRERRYAEQLAAARARAAGASAGEQRSRVRQISDRLAEGKLRAPFAASISRRYVDVGASVGAGDAILRLVSDARLIRFAVPESRAAGLKLGARIRVDFDGRELEAEVRSIAPEVDAGTRLILAEAQVDADAAASVKLGATGEAHFVDGEQGAE